MHRIITLSAVLLLAALIAAGCGKFGEVYTGSDGDNKPQSDTLQSITDEEFTPAVAKEDGCGEIEDVEMRGREHVEEKVDYDDNPPSSGSHNPVPLDWGHYPDGEDDERWVHNLEHGHIVIAHKGLSDKDEKQLLADWRKDKYHLVLLPRDKNPKDGVYYQAWTKSLYCEHPSRAGLQEMREQFLDQGPELVMSDTPKSDEE